MQIDFHHATTYVTARIAGFNHDDADVISYAAQYVDDATSSGTVVFDSGEMYRRINSAHKTIDIRNTKELQNHLVWIPFHFLPANAGQADEQCDASFNERIVCRPNSPVAQMLIRDLLRERHRPYALQLLGVVMHIYADTWAHQGFAGVLGRVNEVEDLELEVRGGGNVVRRLKTKRQELRADIVYDNLPRLGHAQAGTFPDLPFLQWQYRNGNGELVERDNTTEFCEAANEMCKVMQRYRMEDPDAAVAGIGADDLAAIRGLFEELSDDNSRVRHREWRKAIAAGRFSFGSAEVPYAPRGRDSWKAAALGTSDDLSEHAYHDGFLSSNWKLFHDAIQAHRFHVIHDILPRHGICAA